MRSFFQSPSGNRPEPESVPARTPSPRQTTHSLTSSYVPPISRRSSVSGTVVESVDIFVDARESWVPEGEHGSPRGRDLSACRGASRGASPTPTITITPHSTININRSQDSALERADLPTSKPNHLPGQPRAISRQTTITFTNSNSNIVGQLDAVSAVSAKPESTNVTTSTVNVSSPQAHPLPAGAPNRNAMYDASYSTPSSSNVVSSQPEYMEVRHQRMCEVCENSTGAIWFCNVCISSFCETCWAAQFVHRKARGGALHEKTNPDIAEKVNNVLSPPTDDRVREQLYKADEVTSWFGVVRPEDNAPPVFQDYGRFEELMAKTDPVRKKPSFMEQWAEVGRDRRTPSLVSFVGQTGAGKSTLVKLLIDFATEGSQHYSTPVVGPRGAYLPSSEDVHLYLDPRTTESPGPMLYADCEGLEGGEREPLGAMFRRKRRTDSSKEAQQATKAGKVIFERELEWASGPRARSREFAVTNLYPRLLYTFSDVIVFVLRNPRVIEHVFERLVQWAAAAIETSSNQPVLPHAVIALNASENNIDASFWDVKTNTETILKDLALTVNRNETFKKWAQFWRERGKSIDSLLDLILCYYSSIQIIRLPADGRPKLMAEQIEQLYSGTLSACIAARMARNRVRMLLDVEDLHSYLQEAFNHYSGTLESPFDFVQASFRNSPIPPDFGGNILKLALSVMGNYPKMDARRIFSELSYMVASCIMLDSARHKNKGSASQILPKYMNHLDDALENFCDQHWPCEFVNSKTGVRCVNVRSGHTKGHQSEDGKVFAAGDYESKFSWKRNSAGFRNKVYACLVELLQELSQRLQDGQSEEETAPHIHKTLVLNNFFRRSTPDTMLSQDYSPLTSHTACFCCLFGQAEHFLPCGHVLCTECLRSYGHQISTYEFDIHGCPIEGARNRRGPLWTVQLHPKSAGVRILTLDGGGIRGIVELEVLKHLEDALGGIPIQRFFDLMVGTSTGGLVALGLGVMHWGVDKCIEKFESLCDEAFTRRVGSSLPVVGSFIDYYHHSKYQTSTIESALKKAFSEDLLLFGGRRRADYGSPIKVAVTATSQAGNKTYVLGNYNSSRSDQKPSHYHFQRPEAIAAELKIWEAARATTAAPRYFKPFHHEPALKTYIDGAILHNNPVRVADAERKRLWPDSSIPDLFLSIGTGYSASLTRNMSENKATVERGVFNHGRQLYKILRNNMEQTLDCERAWDDYFASVATASTKLFCASRFLRINPDVGSIPALDEKDKMHDLRKTVQASLRRNLRIKDIARQLIASSFYFELLDISESEVDGRFLVQGKIYCRLPQLSSEIRELGKHLRQRGIEGESISFVIYEDGDAEASMKIPLPDRVLGVMIHDQIFDLGRLKFRIKSKVLPTHIVMYFGDVAMHPVSGCPRSFVAEDDQSGSVPVAHPMLTGALSARYTHGSRRLRKTSGNDTWKPPDLRGVQSLSNLRQYAEPGRALGDDGIEVGLTGRAESQTPATTDHPHQGQQVYFGSSPVQRTASPSLIDSVPTRRRNNATRDAFRSLLWPGKARHMDEDDHPYDVSEPQNTSAGRYNRGVMDSIQGNGNAHTQFHDVDATSTVIDAQLASSLQYYNVTPDELEVYRRWVHLLQPDELSKPPWLPPTSETTAGFAQSSYGLHEMPGELSTPEPLTPKDASGPVELPA